MQLLYILVALNYADWMVHNESLKEWKNCEKARKRCEIVDIGEFSIKKQHKPYIILFALNHMIFGQHKIGDVNKKLF